MKYTSEQKEIDSLLREKEKIENDSRISVSSRKARLKSIDKRIKVLENGKQ